MTVAFTRRRPKSVMDYVYGTVRKGSEITLSAIWRTWTIIVDP